MKVGEKAERNGKKLKKKTQQLFKKGCVNQIYKAVKAAIKILLPWDWSCHIIVDFPQLETSKFIAV